MPFKGVESNILFLYETETEHLTFFYFYYLIKN